MVTNVHLVFSGKCSEAFAFYEETFNTKVSFVMKYADAPPGSWVPEGMKEQVMHLSMPLGSIVLMGCDSPPDRASAMGGFQIAVNVDEEGEAKRLFAALSEGGSVQMPMTPTFWSPMFGMCTDKFGVAWMVGVPGPPM